MTRVLAPRLAWRLAQLMTGLVVYGISMAMLIRSRLGNMPWDVLHQGLARQLHHSIGTITIGVSLLVLMLWIPLREKPGVGTVCNVLVIGISVDAALAVIPATGSLLVRGLLAGAGIVLNAVATAAYIGARLGPGARDGLMTGLVRRTGGSVRLVRTIIETAVVVTGWLLGGTLGIATVLYALLIGPLVQMSLPRLTVPDPIKDSSDYTVHLTSDSDMEVDVKKHERPQQDGQDERQELTNIVNRISVSDGYHHSND